jgi:integrase
MASVYRRTPRSKRWTIQWVDAEGARRTRVAFTDRQRSEQLAAKLEREAHEVRVGLVDPKDRRLADEAARPIEDQVGDYRRYLAGKGSTAKHVAATASQILEVCRRCRARAIGGLIPSRVAEALASLEAEGRSARTVNAHRQAIRAFARWLWLDGRARSFDLGLIRARNEEVDVRRGRRALTDLEVAALVAAAAGGDPIGVRFSEKRISKGRGRGWARVPSHVLAGPERAMLYLVAMGTGFRASELASLKPGSFHLGASAPSIVVEASFSKRRRRDEQPIRPDLAAALRPFLAGRPPAEPVWILPEKPGPMLLRKDLEAAGIPWRDDEGRYADFHALRHTYITNIARSGAKVKALVTLARHSDPRLTLRRYAHLGLADLADALDCLPDVPPNTADAGERAG